MRILHWFPGLNATGAIPTCAISLAEAQAQLGAQTAIVGARDRGGHARTISAGSCETLWWQPRATARLGSLTFRVPSRGELHRLRAWSPTAVHIHGEFNPDNLWVHRVFDCPLVLTPAGAFMSIQHGRRGSPKAAYVQLAARLLYRRISRFHAISPLEQQSITTYVPDARVYCVPNGLAEDFRAPLRHEQRSDRLRYVYVGRLDVHNKGIDVLLQAFKRVLAARDGAAELVLAGRDDGRGGRAYVEQWIRAEGMADTVELTGHLTPEALAALLASADICVQLSLWEGFGLALAEALAIGLPAVVSNEYGLATFPEIAGAASVKRVAVDPRSAGDAMLQLADDLDKVSAQASEFRGDVQDFLSWPRIAAEHLSVYQALATERAA